MCFHDALTFKGTGYHGADFIEGFSFWPDFFARVFLGYLLYDLVIMLTFRWASRAECSMPHRARYCALVCCNVDLHPTCAMSSLLRLLLTWEPAWPCRTTYGWSSV